MQFKVIETETEGNPYTHVLFDTGFQSVASIRESIHIRTEDGRPLKVGKSYLITQVKITARLPHSGTFLWEIRCNRRCDYVLKFQKLLDEIAPGMMDKHVFIAQLVVKEKRNVR